MVAEAGTAEPVAGRLTRGVEEGLVEPMGVGFPAIVAEGVETKAGLPLSAAITVKFLTSLVVMLSSPFQEMVIVCSPSTRFLGGDQDQPPSLSIVIDPVWGT